MGLLFSKLLNKLGLLSDEDLAEEILEDAARDIKQAEASLDRALAFDKSDPKEYKKKVDKATATVMRLSVQTDRFITSLNPNLRQSIKNKRTMKKSSHRSPHRSHSPHRSPHRSHGGQTKKRVHRPRYSRRAARRV
jgi:hypothetical protein